MRYRFLLLLVAIAVSWLTFLNAGVVQNTPSVAQANDGFVSINDPTLGDFKIENAPITVQQYCDFLNAVATKGDPHGLYNNEMKGLIAYHPGAWFIKDYYSVVSGQSDLPMTKAKLYDAMRYCNWSDFGQLTATQLGDNAGYVTEQGAYQFNDVPYLIPPSAPFRINPPVIPYKNPNISCSLPNVDQLSIATSQITFPADTDFYEWTSTAALTADAVNNDEAEADDELVFQSSLEEGPATMVCDPSAIDLLIGFRIMQRKRWL